MQLSKDREYLTFYNLKPKEYKAIDAVPPDKQDEETPGDGSNEVDGDTKTGSIVEGLEWFDRNTIDQKNEMLIKEQIGEDKWDERM